VRPERQAAEGALQRAAYVLLAVARHLGADAGVGAVGETRSSAGGHLLSLRWQRRCLLANDARIAAITAHKQHSGAALRYLARCRVDALPRREEATSALRRCALRRNWQNMAARIAIRNQPHPILLHYHALYRAWDVSRLSSFCLLVTDAAGCARRLAARHIISPL